MCYLSRLSSDLLIWAHASINASILFRDRLEPLSNRFSQNHMATVINILSFPISFRLSLSAELCRGLHTHQHSGLDHQKKQRLKRIVETSALASFFFLCLAKTWSDQTIRRLMVLLCHGVVGKVFAPIWQTNSVAFDTFLCTIWFVWTRIEHASTRHINASAGQYVW